MFGERRGHGVIARFRHALFVGVLLVGVACSSNSDMEGRETVASRDSVDTLEEPVHFDFARSRGSAETIVETSRIDLGTLAARKLLGHGWSADETLDGGGTFAWSLGPSSQVRFFVVSPRPLTLSFRGWPLEVEGSMSQRIRVALNHQPVANLEIESGPAEYRVPLELAALSRGENQLAFDYRYTRQPSELWRWSDDHRELAFAWDWIAIEGGCEAPYPTSEGSSPSSSSTVVIPSCSGVAYCVPLKPEHALAIEGIGITGDGNAGSLWIEIETEEPPTITRHELPAVASGPVRITPLTRGAATLARISFFAEPHPGSTGFAAHVQRPRIVAPSRSARSGPIPVAPTPSAAEARAPLRARPNVVLYVIDTLRADHVGALGYDRPITPHIDAFAREALLFPRAYAQSSWTRTAVASILTGLHPAGHATIGRLDALPSAATTLAEILDGEGYGTAGWVANPNVCADAGFGQGYDDYEYLRDPRGAAHFVGSADLTERALVWLDARSSEDPFFLYLHSMDPHDPYDPPAEWRSRFASGVGDESIGSTAMLSDLDNGRLAATPGLRDQLVALYDAEIAYNDASFGALIEGLRARGLYEDTLIALVSDHGEEFLDHGRWKHGKSLFTEQLRILFAIKPSGTEYRAAELATVAQQVDLVPTVLDYLEIPAPPHLEGTRLRPGALPREQAGWDVASFSHLDLDGISASAVILGDYKLIRHGGPRRYRAVRELYDLRQDPLEQNNLAPAMPIRVGYFEQLLREHDSDSALRLEREPASLDPETEAQLRAVGYLN